MSEVSELEKLKKIAKGEKQSPVQFANDQNDESFPHCLKIRRLGLEPNPKTGQFSVDTFEQMKVQCLSFSVLENIYIYGISLFRTVKGEPEPDFQLYIQSGEYVQNELFEMDFNIHE